MLTTILLSALAILVPYLYLSLRRRRFQRWASFPQLPPSLTWGHLKTIHEFQQRGRPNEHTDYVWSEMHKALGRPPVMCVDLWPVQSLPLLVVASHDIAEQVSKPSKPFPRSTPKSPTVDLLVHLIGPSSIVSSQGEEWWALRKRFNPGFAPAHLATLLPRILDKTEAFVKHLDRYVANQESFSLMRLTTNLTFDIIGAVTMNVDFEAQKPCQSLIVRLFSELLEDYAGDKGDVLGWLRPKTELRRRRLARQVNALLGAIVRAEFEEKSSQTTTAGNGARSILSLSLQDTTDLTPSVVDQTCDQLKTFLFAGHDTTSIALSWAFYELSRTPRALAAVRAELDALLGTDSTTPGAVRDRLLRPDGPDLLRRMSYVAAVVKEILRLHPPAATARLAEPGTGLTVRAPTGEEYCIDGMIIFNCHYLIHRDPAVYGETADEFVPERWLGGSGAKLEETTGLGTEGASVGDIDAKAQSQRFPTGAWRPFERGPRNCIGQELANIEAYAIIAVVARRYDFVKVGLGEVSRDEKAQPILEKTGQYRVESALYSTRQVTAKPVDGMNMKVRFAS